MTTDEKEQGGQEPEPEDAEGWLRRGIALDSLGRYEEALDCSLVLPISWHL